MVELCIFYNCSYINHKQKKSHILFIFINVKHKPDIVVLSEHTSTSPSLYLTQW